MTDASASSNHKQLNSVDAARPWGLKVLLACNVFGVCYWYFIICRNVLNYALHPDELPTSAIGLISFASDILWESFFFFALLHESWGIWRGKLHCRIGLQWLLFCGFLYQLSTFARFGLWYGVSAMSITEVSDLTAFSTGYYLLAWWFINFWYFKQNRTQRLR